MPDLSTSSPQAFPRLLAVAALVALVSVGAVAVVARVAEPFASPLGALLSGGTALAGGLAVVRRAVPVVRAQLFGLLIGLSAVVWGVGQMVNGCLVFAGGSYPTAGDLLSTAAGPLAIVAVAMAPRRAVEPRAGLRLGLDALVIGAAAATLVWRLALMGLIDPDTRPALVAVVVVIVELSVAATLVIVALRELDPGMVTAAVGLVLFVASDVTVQREMITGGGAWPWPATAVTCVAWPLICAGLLRVSAAPDVLSDGDRPRAERRRLVGTTVVTSTIFLGILGTFLLDAALDPVTIGLLALVVAAMAGGEVVGALQAGALLSRLGTLAYQDPLTSVGNRRALLDALGAVEPDGGGWLLTVDLDNFRSVNGLLGHGGGDELLVRAAEQLTDAARGARVFRLGGDEFAVLAHGTETAAMRLGDRLVDAVRLAALSVPGVGRVALSASVGISAVDCGKDPLTVLSRSGTAMHAAKAGGRNQCVAYAGPVAAESERRRIVEVRLREALRSRQIRIHAQPIVRLDTGRLAGLEVLARWTDPELGPVPPAEFVAIAEATSLIVPLGDLVLDLAVRAAADLQVDARDITLGINVSPVQLRVPGFAGSLLRRLQEHGVPPGRIVVEVTEQVFVAEDDAAEVEIARLVAGGVVVAVDDFGSGAASLGYLRRIPARVLKLDRSLVASMLTDARSAAIVTSTTGLGRETGLDVVAEGIEDEETAEACRAAGIPFAQGWLWSRDVPIDQVDEVVARLGGAPAPGRAPGTAGIAGMTVSG